jgi:galactokinase
MRHHGSVRHSCGPRRPCALIAQRQLRYEHLWLRSGHLADVAIIVLNSMVKHSVATGDYGVRRHEVESGQIILREHFPGRAAVTRGYKNAFKIEAASYICQAAAGALARNP